MQNVQEIFNRIQDAKREQKEIRAALRDALNNSEEYGKMVEQYKKFREQKKRFEDEMKGSDVNFARLEIIQKGIVTDLEMISDIAFNQLVQGETVGITDEKNNQYEPVFTVRFKKKV